MIPNYYLVRSLGMLDSLWALMIPGALSIYNALLLKNSFEGLPVSLKESARIDGASDLTVFIKIVLPLSLPILATLTLFYAVGKWNSYFNAILYISSRDKWTLQLLLREIITNTTSLTGRWNSRRNAASSLYSLCYDRMCYGSNSLYISLPTKVLC